MATADDERRGMVGRAVMMYIPNIVGLEDEQVCRSVETIVRQSVMVGAGDHESLELVTQTCNEQDFVNHNHLAIASQVYAFMLGRIKSAIPGIDSAELHFLRPDEEGMVRVKFSNFIRTVMENAQPCEDCETCEHREICPVQHFKGFIEGPDDDDEESVEDDFSTQVEKMFGTGRSQFGAN